MTGQTPQPLQHTVEERAELERKGRLLHVMTVAGAIVCAVFLLLMTIPFIGGWWPYYIIFAVLLCCCALSAFLNRKGHLRPAAYLFLLTASLSIFCVILAAVFNEHVVGYVIYYFPLTVLAAGMVLGSRATFGFATVNSALIVIISVVAYLLFDIHVEAYSDEVLASTIPALILCYLMALVAWLYGSSLEGALQQLTEQSRQLKQANIEIHAFSRELEGTVEERTQELREFVSMVAHDLRSPLTTIRGYAELLQEDLGPTPTKRQERALDTISANVGHMLKMTDELLEISRLRSGTARFDMETLPIEAVIEEVCAGFEQLAARRALGLTNKVPPNLPRVSGDHFHLTQVLNNLLTNACNYTPAGEIIVSARPSDGFVEVSVADTGIGIPPEDQRRLFTDFFRGEHHLVRKYKGTGLGLAIARSIVKAHGGQIWVESEVDRGSTFRFTLPQAPAEKT